jgi:hypothetical protein
MAMRPLIVLAVCLKLVSSTVSPVSAEEPTVITKLDFYLIEDLGHTGESQATDVLTVAETFPVKVSFSFFSTLEVTSDAFKLKADEDRWTWNGKEEPPKDVGIELLSSPKIASTMGQPVGVTVGSEKPVQYFEKRPDGLFELKTCDVPYGIRFEATFREGFSDSDGVVCDIEISANLVLKRRPIEGVTLDVGVPITEERKARMPLGRSLKPGRYYGMIFSTDDEGAPAVLIRIRVDVES